MNIGIVATGSCLGARTVSNSAIGSSLQIAEQWVEARTGVKERRFIAADQKNADLAAGAAQEALNSIGMCPKELDLVVVATSTPDRPIPPTSAEVQARIGAENALAFDVNVACAGFLLGMELGRSIMRSSETYRRVLVIGSDIYSRILNPQDRQTYPIFGDGAGAVVLSRVPSPSGILGGRFQTDGRLSEIAVGGPQLPVSPEQLERKEHCAKMVGHQVAAVVRSTFPVMVKEALSRHGLSLDQIDLLVCHQANPRLVSECATAAGFRPDQVLITGDRVGNTGAASVPIGLDVASRDGRIRAGDYILMVSFGAGMTWGWTLLRW